MSKAEFKLLLNCLHPDRAPEERKERFAKAFAVIKRMEGYVRDQRGFRTKRGLTTDDE